MLCSGRIHGVWIQFTQNKAYNIQNTTKVMNEEYLGMYVQFKVQLDVIFLCILYSSLFLALHVSGAICTHLQKHGCSVQP
jgi:hypothetical protein